MVTLLHLLYKGDTVSNALLINAAHAPYLMRIFLLSWALAALAFMPHPAVRGASLLPVYKPNIIPEVSIIELMARPDAYHGQHILVRGFLHVEFEGNALYFSKEHAQHGIHSSLWVQFSGGQVPEEKAEPFHRSYVELVGVFDKNLRGHAGVHKGTLKELRSIRPLRKRYD